MKTNLVILLSILGSAGAIPQSGGAAAPRPSREELCAGFSNDSDCSIRLRSCWSLMGYSAVKDVDWNDMKACLQIRPDMDKCTTFEEVKNRYHGDRNACLLQHLICERALATNPSLLFSKEARDECLRQSTKPQRPEAEDICRGYQDNYKTCLFEYKGCSDRLGTKAEWAALEKCVSNNSRVPLSDDEWPTTQGPSTDGATPAN